MDWISKQEPESFQQLLTGDPEEESVEKIVQDFSSEIIDFLNLQIHSMESPNILQREESMMQGISALELNSKTDFILFKDKIAELAASFVPHDQALYRTLLQDAFPISSLTALAAQDLSLRQQSVKRLVFAVIGISQFRSLTSMLNPKINPCFQQLSVQMDQALNKLNSWGQYLTSTSPEKKPLNQEARIQMIKNSFLHLKLCVARFDLQTKEDMKLELELKRRTLEAKLDQVLEETEYDTSQEAFTHFEHLGQIQAQQHKLNLGIQNIQEQFEKLRTWIPEHESDVEDAVMEWKLDRRLLAYNGFCLVALTSQDGPLLVPGCTLIDPVLHNDAPYLFSSHQSQSAFLKDPDFYIEAVERLLESEVLYQCVLGVCKAPDRVFDVKTLLQDSPPRPMHYDVGTQTPVHFPQHHLESTNHWNLWIPRRKVLALVDLKKRCTHSTQTDFKTFRREFGTQCWLLKSSGMQTMKTQGQTMPKLSRWFTIEH